MKGPSEIVSDSLGFGKVEFERSRDFPVPAGRLFSYLADLRNLPAWREEVRKVRRVSAGRKKPGPGDSCVLDVDRGGDQVEVRVEISRFEQDSLLELRVESEAYRAIETYRFEPDGSVVIRTYYRVPARTDDELGEMFQEYLPQGG